MPFPPEENRIIVPAGAGPLSNAVIVDGAPEAIMLASGQQAAIIWQYSPDGLTRRGFVVSVEPSTLGPAGGELHIFETDFAAPLFKQQLLDFSTFVDGSGQITIAGTANDSIVYAWKADKSFQSANFPPPTASNLRQARAVESTASATYVNFSGNPSFQHNIDWAHTKLRIDMTVTFFTSAGTAGATFGVAIDGTGGGDFDICQLAPTTSAGVHLQASGSRIISGLQAGTRTIRPRQLRLGVGNIQADTADLFTITATEVEA